jgi:hypothetical protein
LESAVHVSIDMRSQECVTSQECLKMSR